MLRLSELKRPLDHAEDALQKAVLKRLRVPPDDVFEQRLVKRSIDARRRDQIQLIHSGCNVPSWSKGRREHATT